MNPSDKLTRQGVRDLNHMGPKKKPPAVEAEKVVEAEEPILVPPTLALPVPATPVPLEK